jgi:hypothetical protein
VKFMCVLCNLRTSNPTTINMQLYIRLNNNNYIDKLTINMQLYILLNNNNYIDKLTINMQLYILLNNNNYLISSRPICNFTHFSWR